MSMVSDRDQQREVSRSVDQHSIMTGSTSFPSNSSVNQGNILLRVQSIIENGDLAMFQRAIGSLTVDLDLNHLINYAIRVGNVSVAKYLHETHGVKYPPGVLVRPPNPLLTAIENGQLALVRRHYTVPDNPDSEVRTALLTAVARGHLGVIKYLFELYEDSTAEFIKIAIKHGQVKVLKLIDQLNPFSRSSTAVDEMVKRAVKYGRINVLRYFNEIGLRPSEFILRQVMDSSTVSVGAVAFLRLHGAAVDDDVLAAAAKHPTVSQYLTEREVPRPSALALVARHGLVSVLEQFTREGIELTEIVADQAAEFGQLSTLKWLYEHGCRCSSIGLERAIENDFREVVEFLFAHDTTQETHSS